MNKSIAFFDFDGTLTSKDSLTEFYKYLYKDSFTAKYYLRNIVLVILVRFGIVDYTCLKMNRLRFLVKCISAQDLQAKAKFFFNEFIKDQFKKEGQKEISELKSNGFEIVIVSASVDLLLSHLKEVIDAKIITNELECIDGIFTGKFVHKKDCNFAEKVQRIKKEYNLKDYDKIYVYGDSKGDFAMFEIADEFFLNHFKV